MNCLATAMPQGEFFTEQYRAITHFDATQIFQAQVVAHIDKFGTKITVRELIKAGKKLEQLGVVAALSASFYVGAVIGSIAVAAGRSLGNGASLADALFTASRNNLHRPWLTSTLQTCPSLYGCGVKRQPR